MDITLPFGTVELLKFAGKKKIDEWQRKKIEVVQEIILAEVKVGNLSSVAEDAFFSAVLRLNKACLEGATRNKLRLMAQVLNGTLSEPSSDRGLYLEQIIADMSEGEIFLVARLCWHAYDYIVEETDGYAALSKEENFANSPYFRIKVDLVPKVYSNKNALDAALSRLSRTGLVTPHSVWGGIIYEVSPLAEELVKLCDIQAYNNPMNFEASAV